MDIELVMRLWRDAIKACPFTAPHPYFAELIAEECAKVAAESGEDAPEAIRRRFKLPKRRQGERINSWRRDN